MAEVGRGSALEISESEQKSAQFGGRKWLWRNSERENKKKKNYEQFKISQRSAIPTLGSRGSRRESY